MKNIALLTATINPSVFDVPFTKLMDKRERLGQYLNAVEDYIKKSNFEIIIFCENSNYNYNYTKLIKLAKSNKKTLEIIQFLGDKDEMKNRGKSYGDAEIIEYALKKSKYLKKNNQTFYKINGKNFIRNINKILKYSNKENYFFSVGKNHCVTLFFKCSRRFYINNLLGVQFECNEHEGKPLEWAFFERVKKREREISRIPEYPIYGGFSGTNGIVYKKGIKWFVRNLQLKLGFLDI